jgi:chloramphenicol O-acetyltransferase
MKKNRGEEPIGSIIHIYIEISQGDSLCSYLYLKQAKMSFFSFSVFSSTKSENMRTEQVLPEDGGVVSVGGSR